MPDPGPIHRIQLPGNPSIESATFSPDGKTLYVLIKDQAINLWEVLVHHWPEIGGGLIAIAAIVFLLALRRTLRTRRIPGEPHCRRCNYCLKSPSDRCPECGTPTKRPVRGRTIRRRLLPIAIPCALMTGIYTLSWALSLPRTGAFAHQLDWWSYRAEALALKQGISLKQWTRPVNRILEIDVVSGSVHGTLFTHPRCRHTWCPIAVTPDGAGMLTTLTDTDRIGIVSLESGRVIASLSHDLPLHRRTSRWFQIAGFEPSRPIVYLVAFDEKNAKTHLVRWNYQTHESTMILQVDADLVSSSEERPKMPWPRRFQFVPGDPPIFLERNSGMWKRNEGRELLLVRSAEHPQELLGTINLPQDTGRGLYFSHDGNKLFGSQLSSLSSFAARNGIEAASLALPPGHLATYQHDRLAFFGWAIVSTHYVGASVQEMMSEVAGKGLERFLIADLDECRWIGAFKQPENSIDAEAVLSTNRRWFAAIVTTSSSGAFIYEVLIYDLRFVHDFLASESRMPQE